MSLTDLLELILHDRLWPRQTIFLYLQIFFFIFANICVCVCVCVCVAILNYQFRAFALFFSGFVYCAAN